MLRYIWQRCVSVDVVVIVVVDDDYDDDYNDDDYDAHDHDHNFVGCSLLPRITHYSCPDYTRQCLMFFLVCYHFVSGFA